MASQLDGNLQFVAGLYYDDNEYDLDQPWLWAGDPLDNPNPGLRRYDLFSDQRTKQEAVFGELSYQLTEHLTATLGARYFDYERIGHANFFILGNEVYADRLLEAKESGTTYKANLSYTPTDDILIYGQWAEGFRLGRGLPTGNPACDTNNDGLVDGLGIPQPSKLDSDTSESFEMGIKTSLADNRITLNAAIYQINWENMPQSIMVVSGCTLLMNAAESKSEGAEIELQAIITENFRLDASASYGEAVFTKDAGVLGKKGDNLPASADFNVTVGLEYAFDLSQYPSFVRLDYSYQSEYYSNTAETGQASGGFGQLNVKTGITINKIQVDLFIHNLTNSDKFTWVESLLASANSKRAYQLRPRTVGVSLNYLF